jgi:prepilin-type N-terminal cleavage/methylation domain-containing protein
MIRCTALHNATPSARTARPARAHRPAFTLVELIASMAIYGLILAAVGAALTLITRAKPRTDALWRARMDGTRLAMQLTSDLQTAISFAERTATAVEFTVFDRGGDGIDDTLRYAWSGTPGDPLMYSVNGGTPATLAPAVHAFSMAYQANPPTAQPRGDELAVLKAHDDAPGGKFKDYGIDATHWCGVYLTPALPAGATKWHLRRFRFRAKRDGAQTDGVIKVIVAQADASGYPTAAVLDTVTVLEATLDANYTWVDVDITSASNLAPTQSVCVIVGFVAGSDKPAKIQYEENGSPMTAGTHWMTSSNAGGTWTGPDAARDMCFTAYGTYDVDTGAGATLLLQGVSVALQLGERTDSLIRTSVRILNAPEVVQP